MPPNLNSETITLKCAYGLALQILMNLQIQLLETVFVLVLLAAMDLIMVGIEHALLVVLVFPNLLIIQLIVVFRFVQQNHIFMLII